MDTASAAQTLPVDAGMALGLLERFGLPLAMLAVVLWALVKAANWMAPRVDGLISRHEKLIDTLEDEQRNHGLLLAKMQAGQVQIVECMNELRRLVLPRRED